MKLRVTVEGTSYDVSVEVLEDAEMVPEGARLRVESAAASRVPPPPRNGGPKVAMPPRTEVTSAKPAASSAATVPGQVKSQRALQPIPEPAPEPKAPATPSHPWHDLTVGTGGEIVAPFPGIVKRIDVKVGDAIAMHDVLLSMQFSPTLGGGSKPLTGTVRALAAGTVRDVLVREGDAVAAGQSLIRLG